MKPSGRYYTSKQIQQELHVTPAYISRIRSFIRKHPERYGIYGVCGNLTNIMAFIDAKAVHNEITKGIEVPEFDMEMAARMLGVHEYAVK